MAGLNELWNKVYETLKSSKRASPTTVVIPRDHIDENQNGAQENSFKRDEHYVQVLINEMYLPKQREWFTKIDPLVYVASEFTYNGKPLIVPFVVGPSLLKDKGVPDQYTTGIIFKNTSVSGINPYRGGGLTLTVVLCEATTDNYARRLLRVIESTAQALDFSPVLSPYTKVANVVMDGFEALFSSGSVTPVVGLRNSYGPNFNTPFRPSYFAMIVAPNVDANSLWVREKELVQGASLESAKPYRDSDFVLYSIVSPDGNTRDDLDTLPFNDLWLRVKKGAASPIEKPDYESAKRDMSTLYEVIVTSPDLTEAQADALADEYVARMKEVHDRAVRFGSLGDDESSPAAKARLDHARNKALSILKL